MKVLLTGATGFLGSHLTISLLLEKKAVIAIKRRGSSLREFDLVCKMRGIDAELLTNLQWVECDLLDTITLSAVMQGIDEVYHTAAVVSFWAKKHPEMMQTNVQGTANVVNCALEAGVKKLCYASSIAALGREKNGDIIDENTPWRDSKINTQYAISKYLAEMEVWRGVEEGLNAVIVNPGIIIGEGKWDKGSCRLVDTAYKGLMFYTQGQNGYVDVLDVCRAMVQLMDSDITAQRYVLVAENLVFKDFFTRLATQFGKRGPSIKAGKVLAQLARVVYGVKSLMNGAEPLITRETARTSQKLFIYKSDKIQNELGFTFTPINQSIQRICDVYKASKNY
jgi:dihydroflavonol-4-reductase